MTREGMRGMTGFLNVDLDVLEGGSCELHRALSQYMERVGCGPEMSSYELRFQSRTVEEALGAICEVLESLPAGLLQEVGKSCRVIANVGTAISEESLRSRVGTAVIEVSVDRLLLERLAGVGVSLAVSVYVLATDVPS